MKLLFFLLFFPFAFAIAVDETTRVGQPAKPLTLLEGNDLSQWQALGSAKWQAKDGILIGGQDGDPKRSGILITRETFGDFDLSLEFMIDEHGKYNSGIYFRRAKSKPLGHPYQLNLGRGVAGEPVGLHMNKWLDKGDEKDLVRKPRQWNQIRLLVIGAHIRAWLNGKPIVNYTDPMPRPDLQQPGTIGLQTYGAEGHAGWVKFRNIRIGRLNKSKAERNPCVSE
jgi:hypothetical protein